MKGQVKLGKSILHALYYPPRLENNFAFVSEPGMWLELRQGYQGQGFSPSIRSLDHFVPGRSFSHRILPS